MELKHKKCGGIISVDIADKFTLRTHSIMVTPSNTSLGVLELDVKSRGGSSVFVCQFCEKRFEQDNLEEITATCLVCSKLKSVEDLYVSYALPCICEECKKEVSNQGKNSELAKCFDVSLSSLQFVKLSEILQKPIE